MALARAMTKRYKNQDTPLLSTPGRAESVRKHDGRIDRSQISLPMKLLSTTNVHVYDNPDIHPNSSSSASSTMSFGDSDRSTSYHSSSSISSTETSPIAFSPTSPEPNHLSTYFQAPGRANSAAGFRRGSSASSEADTPVIPSRAVSHTKKSHHFLARKRSRSQIRSPPSNLSPTSPTTRTSLDMFSSKVDAAHPFGAELAKVNELAEEFGVKDVTIWDEEEQYLVENGLQKFGVQDYMEEIQSLVGGVFEDRSFPMATGWI